MSRPKTKISLGKNRLHTKTFAWWVLLDIKAAATGHAICQYEREIRIEIINCAELYLEMAETKFILAKCSCGCDFSGARPYTGPERCPECGKMVDVEEVSYHVEFEQENLSFSISILQKNWLNKITVDPVLRNRTFNSEWIRKTYGQSYTYTFLVKIHA